MQPGVHAAEVRSWIRTARSARLERVVFQDLPVFRGLTGSWWSGRIRASVAGAIRARFCRTSY